MATIHSIIANHIINAPSAIPINDNPIRNIFHSCPSVLSRDFLNESTVLSPFAMWNLKRENLIAKYIPATKTKIVRIIKNIILIVFVQRSILPLRKATIGTTTTNAKINIMMRISIIARI